MPKNKHTRREESLNQEKSAPSSTLRHVTGAEDFTERRKEARLDIPLKVQYRVAGRQEPSKGAVTRDMSAGGCLLLVTEELLENSDIELDIFLGGDESEVLKLKGSIVRVNRKEKGLYEYGISFSGLSAQARRLFADYCFAKMYEMIGLSEWPTQKNGTGQ